MDLCVFVGCVCVCVCVHTRVCAHARVRMHAPPGLLRPLISLLDLLPPLQGAPL